MEKPLVRLDQVSEFGPGSSFDVMGGDASKIRTTERWRNFVDDATFLGAVIHSEVVEWTERFFPSIEWTRVGEGTRLAHRSRQHRPGPLPKRAGRPSSRVIGAISSPRHRTRLEQRATRGAARQAIRPSVAPPRMVVRWMIRFTPAAVPVAECIIRQLFPQDHVVGLPVVVLGELGLRHVADQLA